MFAMERLSDEQVIDELDSAVRRERESIAEVLRWLIEFDRRRLLDRLAYDSLFAYCVESLRYSPDEAYKRIRVARAAAKRAELLRLLQERRTDLSRLVTVVPYLDQGDSKDLLERACTMKQRELESFVAGLAPRLLTRDVVRRLEFSASAAQSAPAAPPGPGDPAVSGPDPLALPAEGGAGAQATAAGALRETIVPADPGPAAPAGPRDHVVAVTGELSRIAFTADEETVKDLDRACNLLRCRRSTLGPLIGRALKALLREIDPDVRLATKRARRPARDADGGARRIPQRVRDAVWRRDGGRCTFIDRHGRRCNATTGLEFDHIRPWSAGGRSDDPAGIRLLCRLHNQASARAWFGEEFVAGALEASRRARRPLARVREPPR